MEWPYIWLTAGWTGRVFNDFVLIGILLLALLGNEDVEDVNDKVDGGLKIKWKLKVHSVIVSKLKLNLGLKEKFKDQNWMAWPR